MTEKKKNKLTAFWDNPQNMSTVKYFQLFQHFQRFQQFQLFQHPPPFSSHQIYLGKKNIGYYFSSRLWVFLGVLRAMRSPTVPPIRSRLSRLSRSSRSGWVHYLEAVCWRRLLSYIRDSAIRGFEIFNLFRWWSFLGIFRSDGTIERLPGKILKYIQEMSKCCDMRGRYAIILTYTGCPSFS